MATAFILNEEIDLQAGFMLYIMRHGKTDWNAAYRLQGQTDTDLNAEGVRMAQEAAREYKGIHFDVCYCSPLKRARETARLVLDGRDIASNVLPNAKYKFYVTAKAETRAERRLKELNERGDFSQNYEEVLRDIQYRDEQDTHREFAPLTQVPEAIVINTEDYTIEGTRDFLLSHIKED